MPFYKVLVRQDAWLDHEGYVEAENAEHAAELALKAWKGRSRLPVPFKPTGETEGFYEAICEPDDCEEVKPDEFQAKVDLHKELQARSRPGTQQSG